MTTDEIAVLVAIESGRRVEISNEVAEKLRQLGLIYGPTTSGGLMITINGRALLDAHRSAQK